MTATDLLIDGMTCASCAARIERKLNKLDGVTATVNFATETARVDFPATVAVTDLMVVVERAGYTARLPAPPAGQDQDQQDNDAGAQARALRRRLVVSAVLAVPVMAITMIPALRFPGWGWVALVLTTPVATWGAWPPAAPRPSASAAR